MTNQNSKPQKPEKKSGDEINIGGNINKSVIVTGSGNTLNFNKSDSPKDSANKKEKLDKPKKKNSLITVAWIGFWGAVFAALISVLGNNPQVFNGGTAGYQPTAIETFTLTPSLTPTNTLKPNQPTFTPEPPTNTPEPTFTFTPVPPVKLGEDLSQGCISNLWRAYPATVATTDKGNGCWQEPIHAFSAENGRLNFLYQRNNGAPETYGLFARLPIESGKVTITFRLRDLSNADLLLGIFSQPEVTSQGLLMIMLNGNVTPNVFIQKDPINYQTIQGTLQIEQGGGYSVTFEFDNLSARSIVNPAVFFTDSVSIPSSQKWLFLGYKGLNGYYRIEGSFLSLVVEE